MKLFYTSVISALFILLRSGIITAMGSSSACASGERMALYAREVPYSKKLLLEQYAKVMKKGKYPKNKIMVTYVAGDEDDAVMLAHTLSPKKLAAFRRFSSRTFQIYACADGEAYVIYLSLFGPQSQLDDFTASDISTLAAGTVENLGFEDYV